MAQLKTKWIGDGVVTADKIDSTQTYEMENLVIDSTNAVGRIGIGTADPQDPLHIRTLTTATGLRLDLDDGTNGRSYRLFTDSAGDLKIDDIDAVTTRFTIQSGGTVVIAGDSSVLGNFAVQGTTTLINTDVIVTDQIEINQSANSPALIASQDGTGSNATVVRIENAGSGHGLTVDSGNVGFGTTNPDQHLTVIGNIRSSSVISAGSNIDSTGNITASGNITSISGNILTLTGDINSARDLIIARDMTAVSGNIIALSGNLGAGGSLGITGTGIIGGPVGIGTLVPDPASKLHVEGHIVGINGTSNLGSTTRRFAALYLSSAINYSSNLLFDSGGTKLTLTTAGALSAASNISSTGGNITANGSLTATTGNIVASAGTLSIASSSTLTGDVGIGTSPATYKFRVQGTQYISGTSHLGGSVGIGIAPATYNFRVQGTQYISGTSHLGGFVGIGTAPATYNFRVQGTSRLQGNVGIGAAPGGNALYVSGTCDINGALTANSISTDTGGIASNTTLSSGTSLSVGTTSTFNGLVGIGTSPATYNLRVQGTQYISGNSHLQGSVGVGIAPSTYKFRVNGTGYVSSNFGVGGTFSGGQVNCSNITVTGGGVSASSGTVSGAIISGGAISGSGLSITGPYNIGRYFEFSRTGVNIAAWTGQVEYDFTLSSSDTGGHIEAYVSGYWDSNKNRAGYNRFLGSFWLQSNALLSNNVILNEYDDSGLMTMGLSISLFAMGSNVLRVRIWDNNPQRFDGVMIIRFLLVNGAIY